MADDDQGSAGAATPVAAAEARDGPGRGPGEMLREAREARGLTERDLAETLNLAVSTIRALEADDYDRLPRPAFVRGYLRSYARLLTVSPEPLLEAYEARVGRFDPQLEVSAVVRTQPPVLAALVHERPGLVMTVASAAGLLLLVILLLAVWPEQGEPSSRQARREAPEAVAAAPGAGRAPAEETAQADLAQADLAQADLARADLARANLAPGGPGEVDPARASVAPANVARAAPAGTNLADAEPAAAAVPAVREPVASAARVPAAVTAGATAPETGETASGPSITREVDADGRGIRIYAGGEDHLRLVFAADCWVQVRDAEDVSLYGDLNQGGETLDLWGRAPFRVRLGYAPGVELRYNDQPVPLRPHTRGDIASLVVGR